MAIERIKLNLIPAGTMPVCHASQYDKKRQIGIDIYNGLQPYILSDELLELDVRKPDGHIVTIDVPYTAGGNGVVFETTEQMCAVAGSNLCELKITKGEAEIGSINFFMEVEKSPLEGGLPSDSDIENLRTQMQAIAQPMLDDLVPPMVETLVPEVVGDNYYNKTEINTIVSGIDSALEGIGHDIDGINDDIDNLETELESKANANEVVEALEGKADKENTYTKTEVDTLIDNLPEPMIFKGTLGVGGTIQSLPAASASNEGWTYKVITDGTYAGQTAKVGDVFTSNGSAWVYIPSGDEDNDTWRAIKVNGIEALGNGISSGAVDFVGSENIEVEFDGNGNKVGVKTKNIYTKTEVDDIVYNILPDDTASGSVANFETDLALPIKSLEIDVNAVQDLHGYDHPWAGGAGKNIVDFASYFTEGETVTQNGVTATFSNGYLKVTGTNTSSTFNIVYKNSPVTLPAGTYIMPNNLNIRASVDGGANINYNSAITAETSVVIRNFYVVAATGATVNYNIPMMLVKGTTRPTEYEPYENICPIEGWSEIKSVHTGKNLLNLEDWEVNQGVPMIISNGTITLSNSGYQENNNSYTLLNNASYTLSFHFKTIALTNASTSFAVYADGNKVIPEIGGESNGNIRLNSVGYERDVVIKLSGKSNISFGGWAYQGTVEISNIQLELGSTATDYEPYNGNTEVIELGGTYYGGHFTQDKDGHRQFEVRYGYGSKALSEYSSKNDNTNTTRYVFNSITPEVPLRNNNQKCNVAPYVYNTEDNTHFYINTGRNLVIYLPVGTPLTTQVEYIYELETPYVIDLPDGEPIITLNGTNNIYADTGDTSVVFKDSVNGYVEKKIASVQALALNT